MGRCLIVAVDAVVAVAATVFATPASVLPSSIRITGYVVGLVC